MRSSSLRAAPVVALALAVLGCPAPELGEAPFYCHNGYPQCPDDYVCVGEGGGKSGICVKKGTTPPKLDGKVAKPEAGADTGPQPEAGGDTGPQPDLPVKYDQGPTIPGKVVITEFMANPDAGGKVTDNNGEWIELFNLGDTAVDIDGWTLKDAGSDKHVINNGGPLNVPPKGYLLLGRTKDKALNGGVNVVYAWKGTELYISNSDDEIFLEDTTGTQKDGFSYSKAAGFTIPVGASLSVKSPLVDKNKASSWCTETTAWKGSLGDKGTPGSNPGCK